MTDTKQKTCDDAINRQWLMECVNEGWIKFDTEKDKNRFIHLVRDMAPPVTPRSNSEDVAKAFQIGLAIGFGERYDELDKVIDEIKKIITPQNEVDA